MDNCLNRGFTLANGESGAGICARRLRQRPPLSGNCYTLQASACVISEPPHRGAFFCD